MRKFGREAISALLFAGILVPGGVKAQVTIPQHTLIDGMRNAEIMNRVMKNAEERANAAGGGGRANLPAGAPGSAVPPAMFPLGHFGIRYPSNCGLAPLEERFQAEIVTEHRLTWAGIQCSDGTWLQGWTKMLEETTQPVSIGALADAELAYFKNGTYETGSSILGPLSVSRTYTSDPNGACHGIVGVENDWSAYAFVICYPNTLQALWTKEQLRLGLTRLEPQTARFSIPIGPDCTVVYHEALDAAYWCTDGTFLDVSARGLFSTPSLTLEEFAKEKSTMEWADDSLAEREPYRTFMNPFGPFSIERFHKVSDNQDRVCGDIVTQEDVGLYYVIRYCYNKTPEGIRAIDKIRAGIQRGGELPGVELYKIE